MAYHAGVLCSLSQRKGCDVQTPPPEDAGLGRADETLIVLVADDSEIARKFIVSELEAVGPVRILEAATGAECDRLAREEPDLVLLDLTLPDADGLELLRRWQQQAHLPDASILVITAEDRGRRLQECFQAGAADYLRKDASRAEFRARLRSHLSHCRDKARLHRLHNLLDNTQQIAGVGGWELDLRTGVLRWTDELYRILELPRSHPPSVEETIGRYAPGDRDRVQRIVQRAIDDAEPFDFEAQIDTAAGRRIWVHTTGRAVVHHGEVVKLVGAQQDITHRRRIEDDLRESQQRLSLALDATEDGLWDWDFRSGQVYYSERWCRIAGVDPADVPPTFEFWETSILPEDRDAVLDALQRHLQEGVPFSAEYRVRRPDDRIIWVLGRGKAVERAADGRVLRMVGTISDITRRKEAERERDRLFDLSMDMLCVGGFDGYFKELNPAWSRTLGWSTEELMAHEWLHFVHPDDKQPTVDALSALGENRPVMGFENRYQHKDGGYRWISWNTYPLAEEQVVYAVARDVTDLRARQDRLTYEANHDPLTSLYNRGYLLDELEHQVAFAGRYGIPLCFCLCDLDRFKRVNDTWGHPVGDEVLKRFAAILRESCRESDLVGRYGGEEFGIILPGTDSAGATECMERARLALQGEPFDNGAGGTFGISATFGLACPGEGDTAQTLLRRADRALYAGKDAGRNRIVTDCESSRPA
jgi:diguanylate cyclase (GGDEF)-like protein/PAS domain S-box-containing protein